MEFELRDRSDGDPRDSRELVLSVSDREPPLLERDRINLAHQDRESEILGGCLFVDRV